MRDLWTTTEGWLTADMSDWPTMRPWVYKLMLQWAKQDPVDEIEKDRNEVIYGIQGNRNPFVDYPQLADYVWGDSTECQFYIAPKSTTAELFVPAAEVRLDYGLQALSKGLDTVLVVRGRNIPNGLTLSVDNPVFQLGTTQISATQLRNGFAVPLHVKPEAAGRYETVLTITGGSLVQKDTLSVSFVDGIPAYEATDIVCTPYVRRFTANWMNYAPGSKYTLNVYTKDAGGNHKAFNTFTITDTTYYKVTGLKASTMYYYTVSIFEDNVLKVSSNEVAVQMPEVDPVFSVSPQSIIFNTIPGKASNPATVSVTAVSVPEYVTQVSLDAPFEVSSDGEEWSRAITVTGSDIKFLVRMGAVGAEGYFEGEMVLSTKGVEDKVVTLTASVDASKAFLENFEIGTKGGYAAAEVTCSAATWEMSNALIASDDNALDKNCVRMKGYVKSGGVITTPAHIMMVTDKANGCDSLWFVAGSYGTDTGVKMTVSYSVDGGLTWTPVVSSLSVGAMERYGYKINVDGNIRLKFQSENTGNKRVNLDNIQMSDFKNADGLAEMSNAESQKSNVKYDLSGRRATAKQRITIRSGKKSLHP